MSLHSARFLFNLPSPIVFFYHGENKIFHQPALTSKIKKRIFLLSLFYQNNCLQKNLINSIEGHQPIPKSKIPDGTSLTLPVFHQNLFLQIKNKTQEDYTQPRVQYVKAIATYQVTIAIKHNTLCRIINTPIRQA